MFSVQMNHVKLYSIIVFRLPTSMAKQTRCCASNDKQRTVMHAVVAEFMLHFNVKLWALCIGVLKKWEV